MQFIKVSEGQSIAEAVNDANEGDHIHVDTGHYDLGDASINVKSGQTLDLGGSFVTGKAQYLIECGQDTLTPENIGTLDPENVRAGNEVLYTMERGKKQYKPIGQIEKGYEGDIRIYATIAVTGEDIICCDLNTVVRHEDILILKHYPSLPRTRNGLITTSKNDTNISVKNGTLLPKHTGVHAIFARNFRLFNMHYEGGFVGVHSSQTSGGKSIACSFNGQERHGLIVQQSSAWSDVATVMTDMVQTGYWFFGGCNSIYSSGFAVNQTALNHESGDGMTIAETLGGVFSGHLNGTGCYSANTLKNCADIVFNGMLISHGETTGLSIGLMFADKPCENVQAVGCVSFFNDGHGFGIGRSGENCSVHNSIARENHLNPQSKKFWP